MRILLDYHPPRKLIEELSILEIPIMDLNPSKNHHPRSLVDQLTERLPIFDKSGFVLYIQRPGNLKSYLKDLKLSTKPDEWSSNRGESRVFRFRSQAQQFQKVLSKLGYGKTNIATTTDLNSDSWR